MKMWRCEDTNKYLEYMNLRIWGCKDARIQARTLEPKNTRMQGYKQLHSCKMHISISISTIYISVYMIYISNDTMQSTFIFWCTIHQTLPRFLLFWCILCKATPDISSSSANINSVFPDYFSVSYDYGARNL